MSLLRPAALTWILLSVLAPAQAPRPDSGSSAEPARGSPPTSEHFVLEWGGATSHPAASYDGAQALRQAARDGRVGLVALHRRRVDGGWQLEQEVVFPFEGLRLLAVECLSARSPRLVWREIGLAGGRTIFAEWTAQSEELRVLEWGVDGSLRESIATGRGAVMPQYLLDLCRHGELSGGSFRVFDPLSGALEDWVLEVDYLREGTAESEPAGYRRRVELRRSDGSLAGRYLFAGTRLERFQWQEGQLSARWISAQEHRELSEAWGLDGPPPALQDSLDGVRDL